MFLNSNLVTPENFVLFYPSIRKLLNVFFNTDGRTDGWMDGRMDRWMDGRTDGQTDGRTDRQTDTRTPYKMNHPTTLYGYGQNFFLPLTKWSERVFG